MNSRNALIIDDEPDILELLDITLSRMNLQTYTANSYASALEQLAAREFDICLTDMNLGDGNGIDLVTHIQHHHPNTPVAVITAYGSMETAIEALKAGAFDFVSKPVELPRLRKMVEHALNVGSAEKPEPPADDEEVLLGNSSTMKRLREQIQKVARSQAPIYVSGQSGSGKELVAKRIHQLGPRSDKPFVPVNCGAIPSELMESEFFGHIKGSFTGAIADKDGLFQSAQGGTLFLDEVADLPLHMQVKLLRAIQEKSIRPIGAQQEVAIDVRLLSATHKDLAAEVEAGNFRQDMFYRINVIELNVPRLNERHEDIPLLVEHFLEQMSHANSTPVTISEEAITVLQNYGFPGNVRELENILERAFTLCEGDVIQTSDLQLTVTAPETVVDQFPSDEKTSVPIEASATQVDSLDEYLEDIEKTAIVKALEDTRWNRTAAAEKLGISFRQMRHRLKKFGIE